MQIPTPQDDIRELKRRLAQAEAALKAHSAGTQDAGWGRAQGNADAPLPPGEARYHNLFQNMSEGCALHEIVCDENGKPYDYRFLEVNPAFERMTGLRREEISGRLATEVLPGLEPFWIKTYGEVALTGKPVQFDRYTQALERYYRVYAYSPEPGFFAAIFMDISDQKQVELQLNEIAEKYFTLFNTTSDGVWIQDLDGNILEVNDAYCQMAGYSREELIHMPVSELEASMQPAELSERVHKLLTEEGHDRYESRHRRKDGAIFDVDVTALYYDLEGGRIAIFVRDITARKHEDAHLAYLASFPECNPNPIVETELNGKIIYANPKALELFPDLLERTSSHQWCADWSGVIQAIQQDQEKLLLRDVCVGQRWYQQAINHIKPDNLVRIYGIDITDRKQVENEIRQSEARLSRSQEIAHLGSWDLDLVNNKLSWSDEVYRIFGFQPHEFAATYEAFLEAVHPDDQAKVDAAYNNSIRDGLDSYEIEHRIINKATGDVCFVHEKCIHFRDASSRVIRSEGMVHDITRQKHAEEELRRAHDLLEQRVQERTSELELVNTWLRAEVVERQNAQAKIEANLQELQEIQDELQKALLHELETHDQLVQAEKLAAVGRLLASITHEINNPLQTIKNCLYLSKEDITPDSPAFEYLQVASTETDRLSNLVAQLREIYHPHAKGQFKPVELPVLLEEVRILLAGYLQEKHVEWIVTSPDAGQPDGLTIEVVPEQVKQVFLNIGLNAIDAMEPVGGKLMIDLKESDDLTQIGICFRDTGPGLPKEVKARLFEPFITTKEKGLGLGLVICYDLVQKHHGHIEVESEPGKGTAFTIWLPVASGNNNQSSSDRDRNLI